MSAGRRRTLKVLVVMWIAALVLGFVGQTTELLGSGNGIFSWLLLGFGTVGFLAIGAIGIWLVLDWLGRDQASEEPQAR
jgi:hypothetical protein